MTDVRAQLTAAARERDPVVADRMAVKIILAEPDVASAYLLRGRIAALQGDVVSAAHHFRLAYARGDRSAETRVGLGLCLQAAGETDLASRLLAEIEIPAHLVPFSEAVTSQAGPIGQMLRAPLPPRGTAGFLPGETPVPRVETPAPTGGIPASPSGIIRGRSRRKSSTPVPLSASGASRAQTLVGGSMTPNPSLTKSETVPGLPPNLTPTSPGVQRRSVPSAPPPISRAPTPPVSISRVPTPAPRRATTPTPVPRAATPIAQVQSQPPRGLTPAPIVSAGTEGPRVVRRGVERAGPSWLETVEPLELIATDSPSETDWITGNRLDSEVKAGGSISSIGKLELTLDPGELTAAVRSPVTGKQITQAELDEQNASSMMPTFAQMDDPLEAASNFPAVVRADLSIAVLLPGPVMTSPGRSPQQLCRQMAVGLSSTEVVLRDIQKPETHLVRLSYVSIRRIEVLNGGTQISIALPDQRQIHLDFRELRVRARTIATRFIDHLEDALQS